MFNTNPLHAHTTQLNWTEHFHKIFGTRMLQYGTRNAGSRITCRCNAGSDDVTMHPYYAQTTGARQPSQLDLAPESTSTTVHSANAKSEDKFGLDFDLRPFDTRIGARRGPVMRDRSSINRQLTKTNYPQKCSNAVELNSSLNGTSARNSEHSSSAPSWHSLGK